MTTDAMPADASFSMILSDTLHVSLAVPYPDESTAITSWQDAYEQRYSVYRYDSLRCFFYVITDSDEKQIFAAILCVEPMVPPGLREYLIPPLAAIVSEYADIRFMSERRRETYPTLEHFKYCGRSTLNASCWGVEGVGAYEHRHENDENVARICLAVSRDAECGPLEDCECDGGVCPECEECEGQLDVI